MKIKLLPLAAAALLLAMGASLALPQQPANPSTAPAGTVEAAKTAPQLTQGEALLFENIDLKMRLLEDQYNQLVGQVNAEHPGFVFNPQAHTFMPVRAAAAPKPESPKASPAQSQPVPEPRK